MVVVETGSMEHSENRSFVGVIDTGDMVFIKKVGSHSDVTTYVEGRFVGKEKFGDFGDVIVFKKWGSDEHTPVIHRAMAYLEYNTTSNTFSIDKLEKLEEGKDYSFNSDRGSPRSSKGDVLVLHDVGYKRINISIDFSFLENSSNPHSGYITMGDNNSPAVDQLSAGIINETVRLEWIIGKGVLELPWFGLVKLSIQGFSKGTGLPNGVASNSWLSLGITLALLIVFPFVFDLVFSKVISAYKKRSNTCAMCEKTLDEHGDCPDCPVEEIDLDKNPPEEKS